MKPVVLEKGYDARNGGEPYTAGRFEHNGHVIEISVDTYGIAARIDEGIGEYSKNWNKIAAWLEREVGWAPRMEAK